MKLREYIKLYRKHEMEKIKNWLEVRDKERYDWSNYLKIGDLARYDEPELGLRPFANVINKKYKTELVPCVVELDGCEFIGDQLFCLVNIHTKLFKNAKEVEGFFGNLYARINWNDVDEAIKSKELIVFGEYWDVTREYPTQKIYISDDEIYNMNSPRYSKKAVEISKFSEHLSGSIEEDVRYEPLCDIASLFAEGNNQYLQIYGTDFTETLIDGIEEKIRLNQINEKVTEQAERKKQEMLKYEDGVKDLKF